MRSAEPRPVVEVAAAVIGQDGRYLIARRHGSAHLGGYWEFPGGKRTPGESLEACLHREVAEEIGVTIEIIAALDRVTHRYPRRTVRLQFFHCVIASGLPRARGCAELRWVTAPELDRYRFPPANATILRRLAAASF